MKKYRILMLLLSLFLITGCSKKINITTQRVALNVSNKIVKYLKDGKTDTNNLNKNETLIYKDFIDSYEDYSVNLDELVYYPLTDSYDYIDISDYIYEEDGKHLIKYEDIEFNENEDLGYFTPIINNKKVMVPKEYVPIIGEETKDSFYYTYVYDFSNIFEDRIEFYYKGITNSDGITVRVMVDNNKISDIYLVFDNEYNHEKEETKPSIAKDFIMIIVMITIVAGFAYIIVKFLRRF